MKNCTRIFILALYSIILVCMPISSEKLLYQLYVQNTVDKVTQIAYGSE
jgi:hypothetical protein